MPLLWLFCRIAEVSNTQERMRTLVSLAVRFYLWLLQVSGLMELRVFGLEHVPPRATVFVANHPSLLDALFFLAMFPRCVCVVKGRLNSFSPYVFAIRFAGYVTNSHSQGALGELLGQLSKGHSLVIFPEGSRTPVSGQLGKFQRGAANIAQRAGVDLSPVIIRCSPPVLYKERRWHDCPQQKCRVSLEFLPPIAVSVQPAKDNTPWVVSRRVTAELEELFQQRLCSPHARAVAPGG